MEWKKNIQQVYVLQKAVPMHELPIDKKITVGANSKGLTTRGGISNYGSKFGVHSQNIPTNNILKKNLQQSPSSLIQLTLNHILRTPLKIKWLPVNCMMAHVTAQHSEKEKKKPHPSP